MNASLIPKGKRVADIGCDHGKLSVYLIQEGIADKVIASDVATGPLERAKRTVVEAGLADKIDVRLADGAKGIGRDESGAPEVDVIVMAGIGGMLALDMVNESIDIYKDIDCFVIQAQSNIDDLRRSMDQMGFVIIDEDMVFEDGKYYTAIKYRYHEDDVTHMSYCFAGDDGRDNVSGMLDSADAIYGPVLIRRSHPVLHEYLELEYDKYSDILKGFGDVGEDSERVNTRREEIEKRTDLIRELLHKKWRLQ